MDDYPPGTDDRRQPAPGERTKPQPHAKEPAHPARRKHEVKRSKKAKKR